VFPQMIKKAYDVLSDETARASYDHRTKGKTFDPASFKENVPNQSSSKPRPPPPPPPGTQSAAPKADRPPPSSAPPPKASNAQKPAAPHPPSSSSGPRPPTPYSLHATHVETETVTLEWKSTGTSAGVSYELQTRLVHEVGWPKSAPGIKQAACKKKNLKPGTTYSFTVRAVSASGATSPWSIPCRVETSGAPSQPRAPPSQPYGQDERRCDPYNGYPYTFEEFTAYYGGTTEWEQARPPAADPKSFFKPGAMPPPPQSRPPSSSKPTPPAVPPLKMEWACTVCRRKNSAATYNCGVCGTAKDYINDRMGNIRETAESKVAREKERERLRERIRESHAAAERDAAHRPTPRSAQPPPPAAGGWARQGNPAFSTASNSEPPRSSTARSSASASTEPPRPSTARSSASEPSPSRGSPTKDGKATASQARKARRIAMREVLKEKTSSSPPLPPAQPKMAPFPPPPPPRSPNPLQHGAASYPEPSVAPEDVPLKSALLSARRALGKKLSAGLRGVKFAAGYTAGTSERSSSAPP